MFYGIKNTKKHISLLMHSDNVDPKRHSNIWFLNTLALQNILDFFIFLYMLEGSYNRRSLKERGMEDDSNVTIGFKIIIISCSRVF